MGLLFVGKLRIIRFGRVVVRYELVQRTLNDGTMEQWDNTSIIYFEWLISYANTITVGFGSLGFVLRRLVLSPFIL